MDTYIAKMFQPLPVQYNIMGHWVNIFFHAVYVVLLVFVPSQNQQINSFQINYVKPWKYNSKTKQEKKLC